MVYGRCGVSYYIICKGARSVKGHEVQPNQALLPVVAQLVDPNSDKCIEIGRLIEGTAISLRVSIHPIFFGIDFAIVPKYRDEVAVSNHSAKCTAEPFSQLARVGKQASRWAGEKGTLFIKNMSASRFVTPYVEESDLGRQTMNSPRGQAYLENYVYGMNCNEALACTDSRPNYSVMLIHNRIIIIIKNNSKLTFICLFRRSLTLYKPLFSLRHLRKSKRTYVQGLLILINKRNSIEIVSYLDKNNFKIQTRDQAVSTNPGIQNSLVFKVVFYI